MSKFKVGDIVQMPGIPFVVEVLELDVCEDVPCSLGGEIFRFTDPGGQGDDWMHSSEFVEVPA
jgi:hypothetical protein